MFFIPPIVGSIPTELYNNDGHSGGGKDHLKYDFYGERCDIVFRLFFSSLVSIQEEYMVYGAICDMGVKKPYKKVSYCPTCKCKRKFVVFEMYDYIRWTCSHGHVFNVGE